MLLEKGHGVKIPIDSNAEAIMVRSVKESELRRSLQRARQICSSEFQVENRTSFLESWNASNWPQCVCF